MKWVTRERVGVDRMACAWLIRRFIDKEAEFLFIPAGSKEMPEGAEPFDMPGVRYSHRRGHCTFHTLIKEFDLKDQVLQRIARIVDEADTVQEVLLEPVAPGLDLICRGIRSVSENDQKALEMGYVVYEGLYAQIFMEMKI
ncbi:MULTISPECIES: chromate resistance protein ChrB domain-containing protein [unclassified Paenibacillus]|uniref:chromate resistance protein ChrB domain-containing protein n=1 Tax=unclassified Paenibacillus TaxID=185978 RepID=UPI003629FC7F